MLQKNIDKLERKERRNPPIPMCKQTKSRREKELNLQNKHKGRAEW